jgi:hypothetical protein
VRPFASRRRRMIRPGCTPRISDVVFGLSARTHRRPARAR